MKMQWVMFSLGILLLGNLLVLAEEDQIFFKEKCQISYTLDSGEKDTCKGEVILSNEAFTMIFPKDYTILGTPFPRFKICFCGMENVTVIKKGKAFEFIKAKVRWQIKVKHAKDFVEKLKYYISAREKTLAKKQGIASLTSARSVPTALPSYNLGEN